MVISTLLVLIHSLFYNTYMPVVRAKCWATEPRCQHTPSDGACLLVSCLWQQPQVGTKFVIVLGGHARGESWVDPTTATVQFVVSLDTTPVLFLTLN